MSTAQLVRRIEAAEKRLPPAKFRDLPTPIILRQMADGLFTGCDDDPLQPPDRDESAYLHWVADEIEAQRYDRDVGFAEFMARFGDRITDVRTPSTLERHGRRRAWLLPDLAG